LEYLCFKKKNWKLIDSKLNGIRKTRISEKLKESAIQTDYCLKCGSHNLLEPSGYIQACNGIALYVDHSRMNAATPYELLL
jgi:hypothetical protein